MQLELQLELQLENLKSYVDICISHAFALRPAIRIMEILNSKMKFSLKRER